MKQIMAEPFCCLLPPFDGTEKGKPHKRLNASDIPRPHGERWLIWKKTDKKATELVKITTDYAMNTPKKGMCGILISTNCLDVLPSS